jgi:hypothetical protein
MVMRNRHDGKNSPEWWDDLPPAVRKRISPAPSVEREGSWRTNQREPVAYRSGVLRDLARLAVLFLIVALANLLFLLIALSFLASPPPAR